VNIEDITSDYSLTISGGIDDLDISYMNGQKIGSMHCWNCPRIYTVPQSVLVKGENTIAIRVIDTGGLGGFAGQMRLINAAGNINKPDVRIIGCSNFFFIIINWVIRKITF